jgi:hypothetical protein
MPARAAAAVIAAAVRVVLGMVVVFMTGHPPTAG